MAEVVNSISQAVENASANSTADANYLVQVDSDAVSTAIQRLKDREKATIISTGSVSEGTYARAISSIDQSVSNSVLLGAANYTDTGTGREIDPSKAIVTFQGNVIEAISNFVDDVPGYRLIPAANLSATVATDPSAWNSVDSVLFQDTTFGQDTFHHRNIAPGVNAGYKTIYRYVFGFDQITCARYGARPAAGYISQDIDVSDCDYFELVASTYQNIEYSVLDGKSDTPILPLTQEYIEDEKVFFGLPTRFLIDETEPVSVKKNGNLTMYNFNDLQEIEMTREDVYTVSYKPMLSARKYSPKNSTINIKIVQRCVNGSIPVNIKNVQLQKYNNAITKWELIGV